MKLTVQCMTCFDEAAQLSFNAKPADREEETSNIKKFVGYEVELNEDFIYNLVCEYGHEQTSILKTPRFEILMQIAISAILDGYYRDAVASFASALERFYEYYLNIQSIRHGIDSESFEDTWKKNLSKSERQFGAYTIAYLFSEKEAPQALERKSKIDGRTPIEFRNDVIHKGRMPTRNQAIEFGDRVISLIFPILTSLREKLPEYIEEFEESEYENLLRKVKKCKGNHKIIWHRHHSVFGANNKILSREPSVRELLCQFDSFRKMLRISSQLARDYTESS